jgi:hypothetical protein
MEIIPSGQTLGARVEAIDLAEPLSDGDFRTALRALGRPGVLCFPRQTLSTAAFCKSFGDLEINVANLFHERISIGTPANDRFAVGRPMIGWKLHNVALGWRHASAEWSGRRGLVECDSKGRG